jgi:hypothetical protein
LVLFLALAVFFTGCGIGSLYRIPQKIRGCMQLQPASDGGLKLGCEAHRDNQKARHRRA